MPAPALDDGRVTGRLGRNPTESRGQPKSRQQRREPRIRAERIEAGKAVEAEERVELGFRSAEDVAGLVEAVLSALAVQQIIYAEITVSALEYVRQGTPLPALVEVLDRAAARPGMMAIDGRWWTVLSRPRKKDEDEPLFFAVIRPCIWSFTITVDMYNPRPVPFAGSLVVK